MFGFLLLVQAILQTVLGGCSVYQFESQPPLELPSCVPYYYLVNPPEWRLRFNCEVENFSGRSFDVHWFRRGSDNIVQDLGRIDMYDTASQNKIEIVYGLHILNDDYDESMLGEYWCQPIDTSVEPNVYYGRSNIITILEPSEYDSNLPTCTQIINNETVTCADEITNPFEPLHSELPSITSTQVVSTTRFMTTSSSARASVTLTSAVLSSSGSSLTTMLTSSSSLYSTKNPTSSKISLTSISSSLTFSSALAFSPSSTNLSPAFSSAVSTPTSQQTLSPFVTVSISSNKQETTSPMPMTNSPSSTNLESIATTHSSTTGITISPSVSAQSDVPLLEEVDNSLLVTAGSIGGAMLLLIILLSIIIFTLVCVKNKKTHVHSDEAGNVQRLSSLRSSQRPLLNSTSPSSDPTLLTTSFQSAQDNNTPFNHHYSIISDSFQASTSYNLPEHSTNIILQSFHATLPETMIENEHYMTAEGTVPASRIKTPSLNEYDSVNLADTGLVPETSGYSKLGEPVSISKPHPNEYSPLATEKPHLLMHNEGYSVLRTQKQVPPTAPLAYSKLYPSNTTQASPEDELVEPYSKLNCPGSAEDELVEPYSKLNCPGSASSTRNGLVNGYESVDTVAITKKVFDDPRYSTVIHESSPPCDDATQCSMPVKEFEKSTQRKKNPILPPKYRGNYERDPNYEIAKINR